MDIILKSYDFGIFILDPCIPGSRSLCLMLKLLLSGINLVKVQLH